MRILSLLCLIFETINSVPFTDSKNSLSLYIASPLPSSMVAGSTFGSASSSSSSSSFTFFELHAIRIDAFGKRAIDETIDGNDAVARVSAIVIDDENIYNHETLTNGQVTSSEDEVLYANKRRVYEETRQLIDQTASSYSYLNNQYVKLSGKESLLTNFNRGKAIWNVTKTSIDVLPGRFIRLLFSLGETQNGANINGGGSSLPISVIRNTPPAVSQPIRIGRGIPSKLAIVSGPGSSSGGVPFSTQPMVVVIDEAGNECTPRQVSQDLLSSDPDRTSSSDSFTSASPCTGVESYNGLGVKVEAIKTPTRSSTSKDDFILYSLSDPTVKDSNASFPSYYAPFIDGRAIFKGLYFNTAGEGYVLRFTAVLLSLVTGEKNTTNTLSSNSSSSSSNSSSSSSSSHRPRRKPWSALLKNPSLQPQSTQTLSFGTPLSPLLAALAINKTTFVDSNRISIGIGSPKHLRVSKQIDKPTRANEVFKNQPEIELLDAGGNVCIGATGYTISVSIHLNPGRLSRSPTLTKFQRGVLSPMNLYKIYPRSTITATVYKNAEYALISANPFILENTDLGSIKNGDEISFLSENDTPFFLQNQYQNQSLLNSWAQIRHIPLGENRLRLQTPWQGESLIDASIIKRQNALTRQVINGKAIFEGLSIDKIGNGYVLQFTINPPLSSPIQSHQSEQSKQIISHTSFFSDPFEIIHNVPSQLIIIRKASEAWAGGHPFAIQPVVAIADAGGNILLNRGDDVITVTLVKEGCAQHARLLGQRRVRIEDGTAEYVDLAIDQPTCDDLAIRALDSSLNVSSPLFSLLFSANVKGYGHMHIHQHYLQVLHSADALIKPFASTSTSIEVTTTALSLGAALIQSSIANGRGWTLPKRRASQIASGGGALADRFGHAVAVSDDLLVSSSVYSDSPKRNVHILRLVLDDVDATSSYLNGIDAADKTAPPTGRPTDALGFISSPEVLTLTLSAQWKPAIQIVAISKTTNSQLISGAQGGFFTLSLSIDESLSSSFFSMSSQKTVVSRPIPAKADEDFIKAILEADIMLPLGLGLPPQEDDDGSTDSVFVTKLEQDELDTLGYKTAWRVTFVGLKDENTYLPLLTVNSSMLTDASCTVSVIEESKAMFLGGSFKLILPRVGSPLANVRDAYHSSSQGIPLILQNSTPTTGHFAITRALSFNISAQELSHAISEDLLVGPVNVISSVTEPFVPHGPNTPNILPSRVWRIEFSDRNDPLYQESAGGSSSNDIPTLQPDARGLTGHNAEALVHVVRAAVSPPSGSFRLSYRGKKTKALSWNATALEMRNALLETNLVLDADVKVVGKPLLKDSSIDSNIDSFYSEIWKRAVSDTLLSTGATLVREWEVTILQVAEIPDGLPNDDGGGVIEPIGSPLIWVPSGSNLVGGKINEEIDPQIVSSWTPWGIPSMPGVLIGSINGKRPRIEIYSSNVPGDGVLGDGPGKKKSSNGDMIKPGGAGTKTGRVYLSRRLRRNSWMPLQHLIASDGSEHDLFGHSLALSSTVYSQPEEARTYVEEGYFASVGVIAVGAPGSKRRPESSKTTSIDKDVYNSFFPINQENKSKNTTIPAQEREFPSGPFFENVTGLASGAVYVFEPANAWAGITEGHWWQAARIQAPRTSLSPTCSHPLFGWSVALTVSSSSKERHSLIVGSPGDCEDGGEEETGAVYVYNRQPFFSFLTPKDITQMETAESNEERNGILTSNSWGLPTQKLFATTHNSVGGVGYRFGWSVALSNEGDTLAVGAPGANNGIGAVYIFKRQREPGSLFFIDQVLTPLSQHTIKSENSISSIFGYSGTSYGYSVAFGENVLVVGAPGAKALKGSSNAGKTTGCGYIYDRRGWGSLSFGGQLYRRSVVCPEETNVGDRVGISVAASTHAIILGSSSNFEGDSHLVENNSADTDTVDKNVFGKVFSGFATGFGEKLVTEKVHIMSQSPEFAFPSAPGGGSTSPGQAFAIASPVQEVQSIRIVFPLNASFVVESNTLQKQAKLSLWGSFKLQWKRRPLKLVTSEEWADLTVVQRLSGDYKRASIQRVQRQHISPTEWKLITGRRLPWNASPRMVRRSLEGDLGSGRVRVTRTGPGVGGSYSWSITFLNPPLSFLLNDDERSKPLPLLRAMNLLTLVTDAPSPSIGFEGSRADAAYSLLSPHTRVFDLDGKSSSERYPLKILCKPASGITNITNTTKVEFFRSYQLFERKKDCIHIPQPTIRILRLTAPSIPVRGAAFLYTRNPNALPLLNDPFEQAHNATSGIGGSFGFGSEWMPTARLSPHAHQISDLFGFSVAMSPSGAVAAVGSPSRDLPDEQGGSTGLTTGAVFAYELSFLNFAFLNSSKVDTPLSSMATISEGSAHSPQESLNEKDRVSRQLHPGLGVASLHSIEVTVCGKRKISTDAILSQSSCVVPFIADEDSPFLTTNSAISQTGIVVENDENNFVSLTTRPAIVYASTVNGNDWGVSSSSSFSSSSSSSSSSFGSAIQRRSNEHPAISFASKAFLGRYLSSEEKENKVEKKMSAEFASECNAAYSAGRGDCHFSKDGIFDLKGEMDFAPSTILLASNPFINDFDLNLDYSAIEASINNAKKQIDPILPVLIHDDDIVETPDEIFHAKLWLPGMQPLFGGPLWAAICITDDGDGGVGPSEYTTVIRNPVGSNSDEIVTDADTNTHQEQGLGQESNEEKYKSDETALFGSSIAIDSLGRFAVIGSPGENSGKGGARIYRNTLGVWGSECELQRVPSIDIADARFGTAVAIFSSVSSTWVAVSAPGVPSVAIYKLSSSSSSLGGQQYQSLQHSNCSLLWPLQALLLPDLIGAEKLKATHTHKCFGTRDTGVYSAFYASRSTEFRPNGLLLTASDRFGGRGALALMSDGMNGVIAAVGCSGAEAVFIYRSAGLDLNQYRNPDDNSRITIGTSYSAIWSLTRVLRSSEYKEVINPVVSHPLLFGFGSSVAASGTMLVVGAPQAVPPSAPIALNDPRFNQTRQSFLTNYVETYGTGAVFVFYLITGLSLEDIGSDNKYPEKTTWEALADWPAADAAVASADIYFNSAKVLANNRSISTLLPSSFLLACNDLAGDALWVQHTTLVKANARPGDRFGASVAVDGGTIVVGAWGVGTSHIPRARRRSSENSINTSIYESEEEDDDGAVTWDFETGDLRGWTASGNAFIYQPVLYDNAAHRPAYAASTTGHNALFGSTSTDIPSSSSFPSAARAGSGGRGKYWIGTYEARPADLPREEEIPLTARSAADFNITVSSESLIQLGSRNTWRGTSGWRSPRPNTDNIHGTVGVSSSTHPGTFQGDTPTGTLTSLSFYIAGSSISFRIGGGCDNRLVYVELLVDGKSVRKATGGCREEMSVVVWDTIAYIGLSGAIRIVDGSSQTPWGHINVDEFIFSWDTEGFTQLVNAGRAYVYRRVIAPSRIVDASPLSATSSEPKITSTVSQGIDPPFYPPIARNINTRITPCPSSSSSSSSSFLTCVWQLEADLSSPNARTNTRFGFAVAVSEVSGIILIGATNALSLPTTIFEKRERDGEDLSSSLYNEGRLQKRQKTKEQDDVSFEDEYLAIFGVGEAVFGGFPLDSEINKAHELGKELDNEEEETDLDSIRNTPMNFPGGKSFAGGTSDVGLSRSFLLRQSLQFKSAVKSHERYSSRVASSPEETTKQLQQEDGETPLQTSSYTRTASDRNGQRSGAVFAFISEPDKIGGQGQVVTPRAWPQEGMVIELPAGFSTSSTSSSSPSTQNDNTNAVTGLGETVALGSFVACIGAPYSGGGKRKRGGGSAAVIDLRISYSSFSKKDFTDPAKQLQNGGDGTPRGFFKNAPFVHTIKVSASGKIIDPTVVLFPKQGDKVSSIQETSLHSITEKKGLNKGNRGNDDHTTSSSSSTTTTTTTTTNPTRFSDGFLNSIPIYIEAVIPVYRFGISRSLPSSSPASVQAKSGPLHVHYATRDITAVSVSPAVAAKCDLLPNEIRKRCFCGDFIRETGRLLFDTSLSSSTSFRNDVLVSVIRNNCMQERGGNLTRTFAIDLFLPGGARLQSESFSLTIRIEHEQNEVYMNEDGILCEPCLV